MRRQPVESESNSDEDSTMAGDVKIVFQIKSKYAKKFLSQDLLATIGHKNRMEKDTKTKKRPAKVNSTPAKKPRQSENKENNDGKWKCEICTHIFSTWPDLKGHVTNAHKEEKNEKALKSTEWQCGLCQKSYLWKGNLQRHVKMDHSTKKKTKVQCGQCGRKYTTKQNLKRHVKEKHSVDPHKAVSEKTVRTEDKGNISKHKGKLHSFVTPKEVAAVTEKTSQMKDKHKGKVHSNAPLREIAALREKSDVIKDSPSTELQKVPVTKFTKYECKCGKTEDTYDASVRHAQEHLVELEALIRENGTQCELKFDRHVHDDNNRSLIQTVFDYKTLLENSWFNMFKHFKPTELRSAILASSLYKYTRCVKLNWESEKKEEGGGHCVPLYKCGACGLFVEPAKVQNHCDSYRACVDSVPQKHECSECQINFCTSKALTLHKKDHDTYKNLRYRIITFNYEDDKQFNKALREMSLISVENTQAEKQEKVSASPETPARNVLEKNDVHHNATIRVLKYCDLCKRSHSDLEDHSAYHENKRKGIMETVAREEQSCSAEAAEATAKKQSNGNIQKEAEEEYVSDVRKGNVQAHQHNANRMASDDSKGSFMEWDSGNIEKEAEEENVSDVRKGNVQAHQHNANRMASDDSKGSFMEWDSGNIEKEAEEENVSDVRKGNVQAHQHNANRMASDDSKGSFMEWDSGNIEKEAEEENVSDVRKGIVQAHQHNANRKASDDSNGSFMEWDSDSDCDDGDKQSFNTFSSLAQLNLIPKHFGRIVTKEDEIKQKFYNDCSKLQGNRNNDDDAVKVVIGEHDQFDECELTLGRIFGEDNNGVDMMESDNESQSTEDLQRVLEGDAESVLSDGE